jgi:CNT family concentrative nucleoside transporter
MHRNASINIDNINNDNKRKFSVDDENNNNDPINFSIPSLEQVSESPEQQTCLEMGNAALRHEVLDVVEKEGDYEEEGNEEEEQKRTWDIMSLLSSKMERIPNSSSCPTFIRSIYIYLSLEENRNRLGKIIHHSITILMLTIVLGCLFYLVFIQDLIRTSPEKRKNLWIPTFGFLFWLLLAYFCYKWSLVYNNLKLWFKSLYIKVLGKRLKKCQNLEDEAFSNKQEPLTTSAKVDIECVIWGCCLQFMFGLVVLHWSTGYYIIERLGIIVQKILSMSDIGAEFLFGSTYMDHYIAFKVLPIIIYFSSIVSLLYYIGALQLCLKISAFIMIKTMNISGAEAVCVSASIFLGQTETPLLIKPFIAHLTMSELLCVMVSGMATVSGSVLGAYIGFGVSAQHLITASVMSAPASIAISKLMLPEIEQPKTKGKVQLKVEKEGTNVIEAIANGAITGGRLAWNVAIMVLAFTSLLALINLILGTIGNLLFHYTLSIEWFFSYIFAPFAVLIGVPLNDAFNVGTLLGKKTLLNEFIAYADMMRMVKAGLLSHRSFVVSTYALCGFSNIMSIAIQIGGLSALSPNRKVDIARLGIKALIGGTLSCFMTASIAAILIQ